MLKKKRRMARSSLYVSCYKVITAVNLTLSCKDNKFASPEALSSEKTNDLYNKEIVQQSTITIAPMFRKLAACEYFQVVSHNIQSLSTYFSHIACNLVSLSSYDSTR
jgi:hypothetical protein